MTANDGAINSYRTANFRENLGVGKHFAVPSNHRAVRLEQETAQEPGSILPVASNSRPSSLTAQTVTRH